MNGNVPAAVGVDIGCGMAAVRTSLTASDLPETLRDLRSRMEAVVPVGFGQHKATAFTERDASDWASFWRKFDDLTGGSQGIGGLNYNAPEWTGLEAGRRGRSEWMYWVALGTLVLAALTPVGFRLAYWPFVVQDAANDVLAAVSRREPLAEVVGATVDAHVVLPSASELRSPTTTVGRDSPASMAINPVIVTPSMFQTFRPRR